MIARVWWNVALLLAVLVSALLVVKTQYQARQQFVLHEQAQTLGKNTLAENERLRLVIREQSRPERIERLARRELDMQFITPSVTVYLP